MKKRRGGLKWHDYLTILGAIIAVVQIVTTLVAWLYDDTPTVTDRMQATMTAIMERNEPLMGTVTAFALTDAADSTPPPLPELAATSDALFATAEALTTQSRSPNP